MKKTIIALAVPALLAAGSATAAVTLYDDEGTKLTVKGAMEIQYRQTATSDASDGDAKLRVDDGDLAFKVTHTINDDLYAIGAMEFSVGEGQKNPGSNASGTGDVTNDGLYVGLGGSWGEFTAGRQLAIIDDAGVGVDIELKDTAGVSYEDADFDQYLKYRYSSEVFWAGVGYNIAQDDGKAGEKSEELAELAAGIPFGDFEVRGYYGSYDNEVKDNSQEAWNLEAVWSNDTFYVGALYGQSENENNAGLTTKEVDVIELAGSYTFGASTVGLGWAQNDVKGASDEITNIYVNYAYQIRKNVKAYVEVGFEDGLEIAGKTGTQDGTGYAAGLEVKF